MSRLKTNFFIGSLDSRFNADEIIKQARIQAGGYTIRGFGDLFKNHSGKKISTITLEQIKANIKQGQKTEISETVCVHLWYAEKNNDAIIYSFRIDEKGEKKLDRLWIP
jgi:hypothetical protein